MGRATAIRQLELDEFPDETNTVFSNHRELNSPEITIPSGLRLNSRLKMDGLDFLSKLPAGCIPAAFFDPQYRGVLDKMGYGNEGKNRSQARCSLQQMSEGTITAYVFCISKVLMPSGHLFLWMDKFHLVTGFSSWLLGSDLEVVDMITWSKARIGMGYRSRRSSEHLVVLQKTPRKAKGVWKNHTIPDVWEEKVGRNGHAHAKPIDLQGNLITAVTNPGDIVIDPAAGSFSVMEACMANDRKFLGCDING